MGFEVTFGKLVRFAVEWSGVVKDMVAGWIG